MATATQKQARRALDESGIPEDPTTEKPAELEIHPERTMEFRSTSMARMKRSWTGEETAALGDIQWAAKQIIEQEFGRALKVIRQLQEIAQIPVIDLATGEVLRYPDGTPQVMLDEDGNPVEDWSRVQPRDRFNFRHVIDTHMYEWETVAVRLWGEAMYAKALWEQAFSSGFRNLDGRAISGKPTEADRTQVGYARSAEDRFFGVFRSQVSRDADALVRNMQRISRLLESTDRG